MQLAIPHIPARLGRRIRDQHGFTLVELLVVMLLVGILLAIVLPAWLNQRAKGEDTDAKAMIRTTAMALETHRVNEYTYNATPAQLAAIEPAIGHARQLVFSGTDDTWDIAERSASGTLFVAVGAAHAAVVGGRPQPVLAQALGELLGRAPRRDVDDAGRRRAGDVLAQGAELAVLVVEALDREADVRPVEAAHDHHGVAQAEPADDLLPHRRRRGGGEGERRRPAERLRGRPEPQVVGPEVVAPLGDAVRLVDDEQRRCRDGQLVEHLLVGELLGREEDELERVLGELGQRGVALRGGDGRVELGGAARGALAQVVHLLALERDERETTTVAPGVSRPAIW